MAWTRPHVSRDRRHRYLAVAIETELDGTRAPLGDAVDAFQQTVYVIPGWDPLGPPPGSKARVALLEEAHERVVARAHATADPSRVSDPFPAFLQADGAEPSQGWAIAGPGTKTLLRVPRDMEQEVLFAGHVATREFAVHGAKGARWELRRPLDHMGKPVPPLSHDDLQAAVKGALGVSVVATRRRAQRPGWIWLPGYGLRCPQCDDTLELFEAVLPNKKGIHAVNRLFVCAAERVVFRPRDLPDAHRQAAGAWDDFVLAQEDADQLGLTERQGWVYCIRLRDSIGPKEDPRPWVYVGQTSHDTVQLRLEDHLNDYNASADVRDHHDDAAPLMEELYADQPVLRTTAERLAYEKWLYEKLRSEGWPVRGGT